MADNYKCGLYNQLMEVMACLDAMEKDLHEKKQNTKKTPFSQFKVIVKSAMEQQRGRLSEIPAT